MRHRSSIQSRNARERSPLRLHGLPALVGLLAVGLTFMPDPAAAAGFTREVSLDADQLTLVSLIGQVQLKPGAGDRFEVRLEIQGADADPDLITVHVEEGSQARLEVRFPTDEHRNYVYPRLGSGGRTTLREHGDAAGKNWLEKLLGGMGKGVTVRGSGRGLEVWADVTIKVPRGHKAEVRNGAGKITAAAVDAELSLYLKNGPIQVSEHRGPLLCDTGSGSVKVQSIDGPLSVDTGSGSVVVADQRGDRLHVDTGSGSVTIDRADTEHLHVDTGSGGVKARAIRTDRARIDTGSGAVTLELDRMGDGPFVIDTGSGGVRLGLPAEASALINVDTGSGGIRADVPGSEVLHKDRGAMKLRVGDGAASVSIDTGSGGVTIKGQ